MTWAGPYPAGQRPPTSRKSSTSAQVAPRPCRSTAIEPCIGTPTELAEKLETELRALPVRSASAARLIKALQDPRNGPSEIAEALETDAALAVRVLHLANSPFYGLSRRVGSLQQAVTVVGFTTVRSLAAATAIGMVGDDGHGAADDLWRHARTCASVAAVLSRHTDVGGGDTFGAALLHDVGTSLLLRTVPEALDRAATLMRERGVSILEAETSAIGMTHADAGALALDSLGLPERLVEAVRRHHNPPPGSAAALIAASNESAHWLERGGVDDDADAVVAALAHLGLDAADHGALLGEIRDHASGSPRLLAVLR